MQNRSPILELPYVLDSIPAAPAGGAELKVPASPAATAATSTTSTAAIHVSSPSTPPPIIIPIPHDYTCPLASTAISTSASTSNRSTPTGSPSPTSASYLAVVIPPTPSTLSDPVPAAASGSDTGSGSSSGSSPSSLSSSSPTAAVTAITSYATSYHLTQRRRRYLRLCLHVFLFLLFPIVLLALHYYQLLIISFILSTVMCGVRLPVPRQLTCKTSGWCKRWFKLVCLITVPAILIASLLVIRHAGDVTFTSQTFGRLDTLTAANDHMTLQYREDMPQVSLRTPRRQQHGVLLLTGLSASPAEFNPITKGLYDAGIPFYTPTMPGWALTDFHLARHVQYQDWIRAASHALNMMHQVFDRVSIVSHSTGSPIAVYLAANYPRIHHLVLSGPNLRHNEEDAGMRSMVTSSVIGDFIQWLFPVVPKPVRSGRSGPTDTLNDEYHRTGWYASSFPVSAVVQGWEIVDAVTVPFLKNVRCTDVSVWMGESDVTVGSPDTMVPYIREHVPDHIPVTSTLVPHAGHNWFKENTTIAAPPIAKLITLLGTL
jgi:pimeloyl-ACP methyl ester carboxylesterase